MKNIVANYKYVEHLGKTSDILCLQEHWLFGCQLAGKQNKFQEHLPQHQHYVRTVDEKNPLPPIQLPRGYGGVSISWKKQYDEMATKAPDGSNRITCLEIKASKPILIMGTYAPSKGNKQYDTQYADVMDEWQEIITKYKTNHDIIIMGDMNSSRHSEIPDTRDKIS